MFTTQKTPRGFTLIEVLVVIAIVGVTTVAVLVSLSAHRSTRGLDRASREVAAALREAQNYALSGRSGVISENNTSFGLQISSATNYSVVSSTATIGSYSLKDGVTFATGTGTPRLGFQLPRGDVTVDGIQLAAGVSYPIGLTKGSSSLYICLYPTGRIIENGANSTCP